jgi:hypothetical protein
MGRHGDTFYLIFAQKSGGSINGDPLVLRELSSFKSRNGLKSDFMSNNGSKGLRLKAPPFVKRYFRAKVGGVY